MMHTVMYVVHTYIYIYSYFFSGIPYVFTLRFLGFGAQKTQSKDHTGRAGGARADDNFTKKPQKKLIRYMIIFWGFSTKY